MGNCCLPLEDKPLDARIRLNREYVDSIDKIDYQKWREKNVPVNYDDVT